MKITNAAIDRRTTVIVSLGLILVGGLYSYFTMPREAMPEIEVPFVSVSVFYPGVSPEDMESLVTMPIERQLAGLAGVKEMTSSSSEGASIITIEFDADEPMTEAVQRVRDKVALAKADLPIDAEDALVQEANFGELPVVYVNLTGSVGLSELTQLAEDLEDRIEALPGVLNVDVSGDIEREIQIVVDPVRLAHYGVSPAELVQIAQVENVNTPAGSMSIGDAKYLMRVPGELETPDELRDLVVKRGETGVVYLRDLAEIKDGFKEISTYSRLNREPSITLQVSKRTGENVIEVSESIKALVAGLKGSLPAGVNAVITVDQSKEIKSSVEDLESSILSGLVLVIGVLFLFMGLSNAFFVALAIPVSLLLTFSVLLWMGISLNNVTLFALMVALGMLVDNGIVVVENIYRHAQMGKPRIRAAKDGTAEVAWPVFASTVTTIAAFFPLIFWPGIMGKFMRLLPITVCVALMASLFVGLIVNPALAAIFVRAKKSHIHGTDELVGKHFVLDAYGAVLGLALKWRGVTVLLAIMTMFVTMRIYFADFRYEFLPETQPAQAQIEIRGPEGAALNSTDTIARAIEEIVEPDRDYLEYTIANVGRGSVGLGPRSPGSGGFGQTTHLGSVTLDFPDLSEAEIPPSRYLQEIRQAFDGIVGAEIRIDESDQNGPASGPAVQIEVTGEEFPVLDRITKEIRDRIQTVPGLVDLSDDLERGKPTVRVVVDREQAKLAKLNTQYIGAVVQSAVIGRKAGEYRVGDDEYDVMVRFPEEYRQDWSKIEAMSIVNLEGEAIPFLSVARLEQDAGLGSIRRVDRKRMVTITGDADGRLGPEVLADVRARVAEYELPAGYAISYSGENEDVADATRFLVAAFFIAMFLIAMVLVTQFNSILQTGIIMSSVILSLGGVFFGLLIFDMPFSVMMSGIGCVSLAGVVVNNAIVIVDFMNVLRAQGMPLEKAIILAGKVRFRPVMLTAVTTILGLIPMAIGVSFDFRRFAWEVGGGSTQYWGPLAVAVIFGLTFATVLTLLVVPVLYSMTASLSKAVVKSDDGGDSMTFQPEAIAK